MEKKGANDKWMIMKLKKNNDWTNVIFSKLFLKNIFFERNPIGASYVDIGQKIGINDDLTMLCEHG